MKHVWATYPSYTDETLRNTGEFGSLSSFILILGINLAQVISLFLEDPQKGVELID